MGEFKVRIDNIKKIFTTRKEARPIENVSNGRGGRGGGLFLVFDFWDSLLSAAVLAAAHWSWDSIPYLLPPRRPLTAECAYLFFLEL
jgi:hypothetical protein